MVQSPTAYEKLKDGVGGVASKAKDATGGLASKVGNTDAARDAKRALADLVKYAATILIALALNLFFRALFSGIVDDALWIKWVYALGAIAAAIFVCWMTGESLEFCEGLV